MILIQNSLTGSGIAAAEVRELQREAGSYARDLTPVYREKWQEIREILSELLSD